MTSIALLIADIVAVAATAAVAEYLAYCCSEVGLETWTYTFALGFALCVALYATGHYTRRRPFLVECKTIIVASCVSGFLGGYLQVVVTGAASSALLGMPWLVFLAFSIIARIAIKHTLYFLGPWRCRTVLIGSESGIKNASRILKQDRYLGYEPSHKISLYKFGDAMKVIQASMEPDWKGAAFLVMDKDTIQESISLPHRFELEYDVPLGLAFDHNTVPTERCEVHKVIGSYVLFSGGHGAFQQRLGLFCKRVLDVICAFVLLALFSPLMLSIAVVNMLEGGTILYRSKRVGRRGRIFYALKFRTMVPDAEAMLRVLMETNESIRREWSSSFKLTNDPRITRIGNFLRKSSLDELPQLINVVLGEMSLVGPRPILPDERSSYSNEEYSLYCKSTPGLTGLWQISGRDSLDYAHRVQLNMWYIRNRSLILDIFILVKTLLLVPLRANAS